MSLAPAEIKALGAVTDLRTALKAADIGTTYGYQKARTNELPFPVLRVGRQYRVPVAGLLKALGIEDDAEATA
ncbi:DNA-binding protein [Rhodococcus sp. CX]|uniref:DNA-binding protein n=1 Tax=Rhodococcus sp. CX TaxID=2789880 RepID=UPI0018CD50B8|nr:DNA-binding protein [Rhodococcus sp. CX]MBH0118024.1 DNA-binding protein [Rhodococcus sp. CX]